MVRAIQYDYVKYSFTAVRKLVLAEMSGITEIDPDINDLYDLRKDLHLTDDQISILCNTISKKYYISIPFHIIRKVRTLADLTYSLYLSFNNLKD